jgi:hypothetical protein
MASIYIVNHTISGMYPENWTSYHHTESEASDAYDECVASASEDPNLIALIRLDTETLEAVTLRDWEGTCEDLEDEGPEDGETGFEDEDDGIVEGSP